ncbi:TetR/AcrR family transcriptional regulator [Tistrella mobilis]|uniref:TetR/AcrR family transcriptional regulator n=1 Tax=Tistrella mobilis TaxID=171437 RepID=UPI0018D43B5B|nr:TetR/AcrR family transcriptional regulator [Tistrella mobilis]
MAATSGRVRLADRKRAFAREEILNAAERLLLAGDLPDFSMRALSEEAGVSFATPFNHFGSKTGILRSLAQRMFDAITDRYVADSATGAGDAIDRTFMMGRAGCAVWLERPAVHRYLIGTLVAGGPAAGGGSADDPEEFRRRSRALWILALGDYDGIDLAMRPLAVGALPEQLAIMFRGAAALWAGGEVADDQFGAAVDLGIATSLIGYVPAGRRDDLTGRIARAAAVLAPRGAVGESVVVATGSQSD